MDNLVAIPRTVGFSSTSLRNKAAEQFNQFRSFENMLSKLTSRVDDLTNEVNPELARRQRAADQAAEELRQRKAAKLANERALQVERTLSFRPLAKCDRITCRDLSTPPEPAWARLCEPSGGWA